MFNEKELVDRKANRLSELDSDYAAWGHGPGWDHLAFLHGPQAELLARMNAFVRGIDPGEPVNWRGL